MLLAWVMDPPGELMVTSRAEGRYGQAFCSPRAMESVLYGTLVTVFVRGRR